MRLWGHQSRSLIPSPQGQVPRPKHMWHGWHYKRHSLWSHWHTQKLFSAVCEIVCQTVYCHSARCLRLNRVAGMLELKMFTAVCVHVCSVTLTFWYKCDIPAKANNYWNPNFPVSCWQVRRGNVAPCLWRWLGCQLEQCGLSESGV